MAEDFGFEQLCELLKDVKPSLATRKLDPADAIAGDLGLDSLDLLQLGRRIQKRAGISFVMEDWIGQQDGRRNLTLGALLAALDSQ